MDVWCDGRVDPDCDCEWCVLLHVRRQSDWSWGSNSIEQSTDGFQLQAHSTWPPLWVWMWCGIWFVMCFNMIDVNHKLWNVMNGYTRHTWRCLMCDECVVLIWLWLWVMYVSSRSQTIRLELRERQHWAEHWRIPTASSLNFTSWVSGCMLCGICVSAWLMWITNCGM